MANLGGLPLSWVPMEEACGGETGTDEKGTALLKILRVLGNPFGNCGGYFNSQGYLLGNPWNRKWHQTPTL